MTCTQSMVLTAWADYLLCGWVNDDQCFRLFLRRDSRGTWVGLLRLWWCWPASLRLGSLVALALLVVATGWLRGRVG